MAEPVKEKGDITVEILALKLTRSCGDYNTVVPAGCSAALERALAGLNTSITDRGEILLLDDRALDTCSEEARRCYSSHLWVTPNVTFSLTGSADYVPETRSLRFDHSLLHGLTRPSAPLDAVLLFSGGGEVRIIIEETEHTLDGFMPR